MTGDRLLIKNGTVCSCEGSFLADILIENGKIKAIGEELPAAFGDRLYVDACSVLDAGGCLVLPGGVDVHTHMDLDLGKYRAVDDFYTGTAAAALGGTTTIVDHLAFGPKGCSLRSQIDRYQSLAGGKAAVDYSFHGVFQHVNDGILQEMEQLVRDGITSFKIYMTYDNMLMDDDILRVLIKAKELGAVIAVHAENDGAVRYLREHFANEGKKAPIYHALSRPDSTEAEAVSRMVYLSEMAGYPHLYFVHVSSKKALGEIIAARRRGAKNLYCETCPQYLLLTEDKYREGPEEGLKYIMAPPLRKLEDVETLWEGIKNGHVDVIATDHCPFLLEQKLNGRDDFRAAPGGIAGVEERIEVILTEGFKRDIPAETLTALLSTNPAKIYGLYPGKGTIRPGSDADMVILKKQKKIISRSNRHTNADYTAYEGFEAGFGVETVLQRGRILADKGRLTAEKGSGAFLRRGQCTR